MKKLIIITIGLIGFVFFLFTFTNMIVSAEPAQYEVTFQSMFDASNTGTPESLGSQAYHTTIQLNTNVNAAVSPEGDYAFAFWVVNNVVRKDLPVDHTFVVIGDLDIIAVFSKTGEHAVLFMDSNSKLIEAQYVLNGQNAIDSGLTLPNKPGFIVNTTMKWSESTLNVIDDTVLILQYEKEITDTFTLSVTGGTGSGTYNFNQIVTVVATVDATPFSHWENPAGVVLSTESEYSFTMLENKEVTAVFSTTPEVDANRIILSSDLDIRSGYRSYMAQFYIPIGYTYIDSGMLTLTEDKPILDYETPNVITHQGFKYFGETKEFIMSFPIGSHYSIRAYLVVEDTEGVLHRFYSEVNIRYVHQGPVDLGLAYYFAVLSSSGISTTAGTFITGDVGLSPAAALYITGFNQSFDVSGQFSTSPLVDGKIYAADYTVPTPAFLTSAVGNMGTAYTDASSRAPTSAEYIDIGAGTIGGQTLAPGVYHWNSALSITSDITLSGSATDYWIFQITGAVAQTANMSIILAGGAVAENVVWVVAGTVTIGVGANFVGTILSKTSVHLQTGATLNGRILAQTATTLDASIIS